MYNLKRIFVTLTVVILTFGWAAEEAKPTPATYPQPQRINRLLLCRPPRSLRPNQLDTSTACCWDNSGNRGKDS
jgi:hypothetical protein